MHLYWFQRDAEAYHERKIPLLHLYHLYTSHYKIIQIYNKTEKIKIIKKRNSFVWDLSSLLFTETTNHFLTSVTEGNGHLFSYKNFILPKWSLVPVIIVD